jgi:hypothetical protein
MFSICCKKLNTSTTALKAILTLVTYSLRAAFKLSKLSDTPQEEFTCYSEIGSESHLHLPERMLTRQFLSVMCALKIHQSPTF